MILKLQEHCEALRPAAAAAEDRPLLGSISGHHGAPHGPHIDELDALLRPIGQRQRHLTIDDQTGRALCVDEAVDVER